MTTPTTSMMASLMLTVKGVPAPQGSKSFKGMRGGHAVLAESSKKVGPWRSDVKAAAEAALPEGWVPLDGPVAVTAVFYLSRPKSHPKTRRTYPTVYPDLDKIVRSSFDALKAAGVWVDDSRCVDLMTKKRYAHPVTLALPGEMLSPGAVITVSMVEDAP